MLFYFNIIHNFYDTFNLEFFFKCLSVKTH